MTPAAKLEQSELRRTQKSFTTSRNWTQLRLNGKFSRCGCMPRLHCVRWKQHARSRCGIPSVHHGPTLGQSRRHSSNARTCSAARILRQNLRFFAKASALAASTTSSGCMAAQSCKKKRAAEIYDEVGQRSLERLFLAFTEDSFGASNTQCWPTWDRTQRERETLRVQHSLGALIAAEPRILAMIQDAVTAGLLPQTTLGDSPCCCHRSSHHHLPRSPRRRRQSYCQATRSESSPGSGRSMAVEGHNRPAITNPTVLEIALKMITMRTWISLRLLGSADSVHNSSKRSFHG